MYQVFTITVSSNQTGIKSLLSKLAPTNQVSSLYYHTQLQPSKYQVFTITVSSNQACIKCLLSQLAPTKHVSSIYYHS